MSVETRRVTGCWECKHLRHGFECTHPDMPEDDRYVEDQGTGDGVMAMLGAAYFRPSECPLRGTGALIGETREELVQLRIHKACDDSDGNVALVLLGVKSWHDYGEDDVSHNGLVVNVLVDPWARDADMVRALPYPEQAVRIFNRERGLK